VNQHATLQFGLASVVTLAALVACSGSTVKHPTGGLKSIFGGNISEYEKVCEQARFEAFQRVITQAKRQGADAIIGVRYDATEFIQGSTEVLAYGTAVKLLKVH